MFYLQATGRSGSTYLRDLLCSHPAIAMRGEFLNLNPKFSGTFHAFWSDLVGQDHSWLYPSRRDEVVARYFAVSALDAACWGLDLKLEYLANEPTLEAPLYSRADRIIILKRRNVLRQIISADLLRTRLASGKHEAHGPATPPPIKVRLDPASTIRRMREKTELVARYEARARQVKPVFEVLYEDLATPAGVQVLHDLQVFLGVEPQELTSPLKKQTPYALSEVIENAGQLAEALRATEFADLLEGADAA